MTIKKTIKWLSVLVVTLTGYVVYGCVEAHRYHMAAFMGFLGVSTLIIYGLIWRRQKE